MIIRDTMRPVGLLTEGAEAGPSYWIKGVFAQAERKNANGRVYPEDVLDREMQKYVREKVARRRSIGELKHPNSSQIDPDRTSHIVTELTKQGTDWYGKAKILDGTPCGEIVKSFIRNGVEFGVSTRGSGDVRRVNGVDRVLPNFSLIAIDIVTTPSAPDAYVQGLYESAEWVMDNGIIDTDTMDAMRKKVFFSHIDQTLKEEIMLSALKRMIGYK